jgi:hypothetical protein
MSSDINSLLEDTSGNIAELLKEWIKTHDTIDTEHYLYDKTPDSIQTDVNESIDVLDCIPFATKKQYKEKLKHWRFIEDLRDFQRGKHIRCIHKQTGKLTNTAIGLELKFTKHGTNIQCRYIHSGPRVIEYGMDNYYIYQKISDEEKILLLANQYAKQGAIP